MAYISFQPNDYFNTKLYTGNGSTQNITGVGHQVDWTWIKHRTDTEGHGLFDVLRGALYRLQSNSDSVSSSQAGTVTAFGSDGFSLGNNAEVNANNGSYVSWNWKAGTTGSGTSTGSGTGKAYSYSVSTTSGFSIVKYVGNGTAGHTIPHHLGAVPKMLITKNLGRGEHWRVYHSSLGNANKLNLNNDTASASATEWNSTTPTSSVFSIGTGEQINYNDDNYIAYCFAEKKGFSKFGKYNGLGTTTGQFVYTGFKPAFVMTKIATTGGSDTGGWVMLNNKSYPNNLSNSPVLFANGTYAESDSYNGEMFSNGFRFNANSVTVNGSGNSYIYMAFAESPLVSSNGVPATAR